MDRITEKLDHGWQVASHEQKLWLPRGGLPYGEVANFDLVDQRTLQIGEWQGEPIWLVQLQWRHDMGSVRQVIDLGAELFQLAGCDVQLTRFYRSYKYHGYYGHEMCPSKTEWAMLCSHCREYYHPQIAPYIIIAICHDDPTLLAQHTRHRNSVHTVLAGLIEVGEALEQTVAREVIEKSGVKIKNLRCATSRPWPFPQSLMTALITEYDSGEVVIDSRELLEANQYRYDDLPSLPPPGTVVRRLIGDTVVMCWVEHER